MDSGSGWRYHDQVGDRLDLLALDMDAVVLQALRHPALRHGDRGRGRAGHSPAAAILPSAKPQV